MSILTKPTAAQLRMRAEAAEAAAFEAERLVSTARVDAARSLADADTAGAQRARALAAVQAVQAETQRDLAAELHRRANDAERAEALAAYEKLRSAAERCVKQGDRALRSLLVEMARGFADAQAAQREAAMACHHAANAYERLPADAGATPPPTPVDPLLTNGPQITRFGTLSAWRVME
jgi:hypothetical protein